MVSLLLASKGLLLYSASSSVLTGVMLGVMYKRFNALNKDQAQQIERLQATQQALEARLAAVQTNAALTQEPVSGSVSVLPRAKVSSGDMEGTKGLFLKHLVQANVKLQADSA